jgi:hypothetical protein
VTDINTICDALIDCLAPMGGHATILNDDFIALSWNGLSGTVIPEPDGSYSLTVSTIWRDSDNVLVSRAEDVPETVVDLFTNFWVRRGIPFK